MPSYSVGCSNDNRKVKRNQMQTTRRYSTTRRLLFPFSGEEQLTFNQGLRVILAWMLVFPLPISMLVIVMELLGSASFAHVVTAFLFALLSGACIFGLLAWLIVAVNNRSARIRRAWKTQKGQY